VGSSSSSLPILVRLFLKRFCICLLIFLEVQCIDIFLLSNWFLIS
jgi:hypothetical protein